MGERFVVVPVDGGVGVPVDEQPSSASAADPAAIRRDKEEEEDSGSQVQDGVLPILEYNREPNKYGMIAEPDPLPRFMCVSLAYF